jgi:dihydrofolate reductase
MCATDARLVIVSAMAANRVIGAGDGMPWNVPDEYRHFLELIRDDTVLMGRRSWEIFGGDLTSAHNVVVSRSAGTIAGATVVDSLDRAIGVARGFGRTVWSAGGGRIYRQTVPLADEMALSFIKGEFEGDTFFPEFDDADWDVIEREQHTAYEYVRYRRR